MTPPNIGLKLKVAANISSLLKKPEKGGIPEMARQATKKVICVTGRYFLNPPIWLISLLCTA